MKLASPKSHTGPACVNQEWDGRRGLDCTCYAVLCLQIGWATIHCPFTAEEGVGDAPDSYAIDGKRLRCVTNLPERRPAWLYLSSWPRHDPTRSLQQLLHASHHSPAHEDSHAFHSFG